MPKKVSLEPGFEVNFPDRAYAEIKNNPTSLPRTVQEEMFEKRLKSIYEKNPLEGEFRIVREEKRRDGIVDAFASLNRAIRIGVQSRNLAGGRTPQGVMIGDVDVAIETINEEFERFSLGYDEKIFADPATMVMSLNVVYEGPHVVH